MPDFCQGRKGPDPQYSQFSTARGDVEMNLLLKQCLNKPRYFGAHPTKFQSYLLQSLKILMGGVEDGVINGAGFWLFSHYGFKIPSLCPFWVCQVNYYSPICFSVFKM